MSKRQIILFVVFSSLAIVFVLLINGRRSMELRGDKPIDFVYAIEDLDAAMNFGNESESLKYFNALLNTQKLITQRAEELYKLGMCNEKIVEYLMANDPKFILNNASLEEKAKAEKIIELVYGGKK